MSVVPTSIAETGVARLASGEAFLIDLKRASAEVLLEIAEKTRGHARANGGEGLRFARPRQCPRHFFSDRPIDDTGAVAAAGARIATA